MGLQRLNAKREVVVKFQRRRTTPKELRPVYRVRLCPEVSCTVMDL